MCNDPLNWPEWPELEKKRQRSQKSSILWDFYQEKLSIDVLYQYGHDSTQVPTERTSLTPEDCLSVGGWGNQNARNSQLPLHPEAWCNFKVCSLFADDYFSSENPAAGGFPLDFLTLIKKRGSGPKDGSEIKDFQEVKWKLIDLWISHYPQFPGKWKWSSLLSSQIQELVFFFFSSNNKFYGIFLVPTTCQFYTRICSILIPDFSKAHDDHFHTCHKKEELNFIRGNLINWWLSTGAQLVKC